MIFGALRLAKFNNDTRQEDSFYGLPVPSSAIFVSGFPFIADEKASNFHGFLTNEYTLVILTLTLAVLLLGIVVY